MTSAAGGVLDAGTARLGQALDPVMQPVRRVHDAARLARRAVLVEDAEDGRRDRALARVAAGARHDVVHRAGQAGAEVRTRIRLVDPTRGMALRTTERGVAAGSETVEPLRESLLDEVRPEPHAEHVVHALLADAVRLDADRAAGRQELVVGERLGDDERVTGTGRRGDARESREA